MKFRSILISAFIGTTLSACGFTEGSTPEGVWRKRSYVVEVDTPQGVVSGYSVVGHRYDCGYSFPQGKICSMSTRMEAATVDLPNGETLYMTVTNKGFNDQWPFAAPDAWEGNADVEFTGIYRSDQMPDFVMFENENDPTTIYEINPEHVFGDGYSINRAYVDVNTTEKITNDIPRRLPWVTSITGSIGGESSRVNDGTVLNKYGPISFIG